MNGAGFLYMFDSAGYDVIKALLSIVWQSSILFLICGVIVFFLRRRNEAARHTVWVCSIFVMPLLPLLWVFAALLEAPKVEVPIIPAYGFHVQQPVTELPFLESESAFVIEPGLLPMTEMADDLFHGSVEKERMIDARGIIDVFLNYPWGMAFLAYLAVAALMLLYVFFGIGRINQLVSKSSPVMDDRVLEKFKSISKLLSISREINILESDMVKGPFACGVLRSFVIFPRGFAEKLEDDELESVIAHELAHVKRHDPLIFTMLSVIRAIFFIQPMVWFASREAGYLAECACDNAVLDLTGEKHSYARLISRLASELSAAIDPDYAAGFVFSRGVFLKRVESILSGGGRSRRLSNPKIAGIVLIGLFALGTALAVPLGSRIKSKENIESLIKKAEYYESLVHSGRAVYDINMKSHVGEIIHKSNTHAKCVFKGDLYYSESKTDFEPYSSDTYTYSKISLYTPEYVQDQVYSERIGTRGRIYSPQSERNKYFATSYEMRIDGIKVSDFLKGIYINTSGWSVKIIGNERINGFDCIVVHMKKKVKYEGFRFPIDDELWTDRQITVWLSPAHQLKPLQIKEGSSTRNHPPYYYLTNIDHILKDGIWRPQKLVSKKFGVKGDFVEIITFSEFVINVPIDDEEFSWRLPKGTKAYDNRIKRYVTIE